jgi:probable rRNA maturation factor
MSLLFVDATTIAELNERFLGRSGPTDVLAFPIDDELPPSGRQPDQAAAAPAPRGAGRSADAARRRRRVPGGREPAGARAECDADDELALLVVHGVLHLLDYDHAEPSEAS